MEFKEQIQRILENVPKVYEAGKSSINQEVSNALKGNASGSIVALKDVSPIEHNLKVKISGVDNPEAVKITEQGKNLIPYPYQESTKTENGVTFTDNGDGSVTLSGTATAEARFYLRLCNSADEYINVGKEAFLSGCPKGAYANGVLMEGSFISKTSGSAYWSGDYGNGYDVPTDMLLSHLYIGAMAGFTFDNVTIYPQLELGTLTEYELYREPTEYAYGEEIKSISPSTTLMTDTEGAVISVEYNKDINKAFAELQKAIISIGGNV